VIVVWQRRCRWPQPEPLAGRVKAQAWLGQTAWPPKSGQELPVLTEKPGFLPFLAPNPSSNFNLARIPKSEWGAHASRVRVRASRPNFRRTRCRKLPAEKSWCAEIFGATPKTTRQRRVLPETSLGSRFLFRKSGLEVADFHSANAFFNLAVAEIGSANADFGLVIAGPV
jgi:hypothetical protein